MSTLVVHAVFTYFPGAADVHVVQDSPVNVLEDWYWPESQLAHPMLAKTVQSEVFLCPAAHVPQLRHAVPVNSSVAW